MNGCLSLEWLLSISIVYPHEGVAGWLLPLPSVTRQDFLLHTPSLANSKFKIQSIVSAECIWLLHHCKVKPL